VKGIKETHKISVVGIYFDCSKHLSVNIPQRLKMFYNDDCKVEKNDLEKRYSYLRASIGSRLAARYAGYVPKAIPSIVQTIMLRTTQGTGKNKGNLIALPRR
jgi:hypothetical protein